MTRLYCSQIILIACTKQVVLVLRQLIWGTSSKIYNWSTLNPRFDWTKLKASGKVKTKMILTLQWCQQTTGLSTTKLIRIRIRNELVKLDKLDKPWTTISHGVYPFTTKTGILMCSTTLWNTHLSLVRTHKDLLWKRFLTTFSRWNRWCLKLRAVSSHLRIQFQTSMLYSNFHNL